MSTTGTRWVHLVGDDLPAGVDDRAWLGGKGKSLQDMRAAGFPVPPAFVISTEACSWFFAHDQQWPPELVEEVDRGIRHLEQEMGLRFGTGARPLLVSVRSGAAKSMPGMMDTLLNVGLSFDLAAEVGDDADYWALYLQFLAMYAETCDELAEERFADLLAESEAGRADRALMQRAVERYEELSGRGFPTDPRELLHACIETVFRSWHNERAIQYRKRHDIRGLDGTAVTVQAMFPAQVSGIAFTQDPTNLEARHLVIESSYGLGESVVSGDVAPDRFEVDRDDLASVRARIGHKASAVRALGDRGDYDPEAESISRDKLRELCELCLKLEEHMGTPLDLEWGLVDGKLGLLQCRAIRGLEIARDVERGRLEEIERLAALAAGRRRIWVSHNLSETLRHPTPMTWDLVQRFMRGDGGFGRLYQDLGYLPSARVRESGFLELICGQIYADPERLAELFWDRLPMRYELERVVREPKLLDQAPTRFDPDGVDGGVVLHLPRVLTAMMRSGRRMKELRADGKRRFDEDVLPDWSRWIAAERERDVRSAETAEVLAILEARCRKTLEDFAGESLKPGFVGGLALEKLRGLLASLAGEEEGSALARTLTTGLEGDVTFEQDLMLYQAAHGEIDLDAFIERFGHRAVGEMELMRERWWEDRGYLEQTLQRLHGGRDPRQLHHDKLEERRAAEERLPDQLAEWGGRSFREEIERELATARALLPYRENGKFYLMQGWDLMRRCLVALGERWDIGTDVFFLRYEELPRFESERERLVEHIGQRRIRWQSQQRLEPAPVVDSTALEELGLVASATVGSGSGVLEGEAMASGLGAGPARIVADPASAGDIGHDYILVCSSTDPGWTPLFMNARGLIVERGGTLSHGAIVARDFGIPAVVCPGATSRIPEGAQVRVDGNRGTVEILEQ